MTLIEPNRRAGLRPIFTAAILLGFALPAAGADWLFPASGSDFYDIAGSWSTGVVPGAGDAADFLGANTGFIQWDNLTGNTSSASLLVDEADITFLNATASDPTKTHTVLGNAFVRNNGVLNLGLSATQPMLLRVGGTISIVDGGQFNASFGSQVTVGGDLFVGDISGQSASVTIDGVGTTLNANGNVNIAGGTLDLQIGARFNLAGALQFNGGVFSISGASTLTQTGTAQVNIGGQGVANSNLNITTGGTFNTGTGTSTFGANSTTTIQSAGTLNVLGELRVLGGTVNIDGFNSALVKYGTEPITLGSATGDATTINVQNASVWGTDTGTTTINATATINLDSGGYFFVGDTIVLGQVNMTRADFSANHLQLNGGAINTTADSRIFVNRLTGLANDASFAGGSTLEVKLET